MIRLKYGHCEIELKEPEYYDLLNLSKACIEKINDHDKEKEIVKEALSNPIDCSALEEWISKEDKIVIIVPDITRKCASSLYLSEIIKALEKKNISVKNVKIIIALGNHRKNTDEEKKMIVGEKIFNKYTVLNHDSENNLEYVGTTKYGNKIKINKYVNQADKIILTGGAAFHNFVGYSGGRKGILPGVSGKETILFNHKLMVQEDRMSPKSEMGIIHGNLLHEDMLEAIKLVGLKRIFLLNVVTNMHGEIMNAFSGCPIAAHKKACAFVKENFAIVINEKYDIIMCSSGGFPFDLSFYQAYKGAYCSLNGLKENGIIIMVSSCIEGYGEGEEEIDFWFSKDRKGVLETFEHKFDMNGKIAYDIKVMQERSKDLFLVTKGNEKIINTIGINKIESSKMNEEIKSIIKKYEEKENKKPRVGILPYSNITLLIDESLMNQYEI